MRNALALLMALSAVVAPDIASANAGSPMFLAAKAKLLDGMKQCGVASDTTTIDEGSSPNNIDAKIKENAKALGDTVVLCLAEKFDDNQGQIEFLDENTNTLFQQTVDEVSLRNRRAGLDRVQERAIACGIPKGALSRDDGGIGQSASLIISSETAPVSDTVLGCIAAKAVNEYIIVDFTDPKDQDRYYLERAMLWRDEERSKANKILMSTKLVGQFRTYNPAQGTLKAYGQATEKLCGAKQGSYLRSATAHFLEWKNFVGGLEDYPELAGKAGCIWAALTLADLADHGAGFGHMLAINSSLVTSRDPDSGTKTK
jgi:hypothetical protein